MERSRNKDLSSHLGIKVVTSCTEGHAQTNCEKLNIRHSTSSRPKVRLRGLHCQLAGRALDGNEFITLVFFLCYEHIQRVVRGVPLSKHLRCTEVWIDSPQAYLISFSAVERRGSEIFSRI